jgi:hypothetical protein
MLSCVARVDSFDRKALTAAFTRARELLTSPVPVSAADALHNEQLLRPLASAWEIQQVVVPLLDRAELFGLAMAWDSSAEPKPEEWLASRADRWLALCAPEFGFLTLCELRRLQLSTDQLEPRLHAALDAERELRGRVFDANLAALAEVEPALVHALQKAHRTSVALRPLGAGCAEFAGLGQPWVQLWAVTPNDALADADVHVAKCCVYEDAFIAGVGDCTLPAAAARQVKAGGRMHIVELHTSRMRALLEVVDLSEAVRKRSVMLHTGPQVLETLGVFAEHAVADPDSIAGADNLALSLIRAAAGQEPSDGAPD